MELNNQNLKQNTQNIQWNPNNTFNQNVPNFPVLKRNSIVSSESTHYSSNNKKKGQELFNFDEGESVEYFDGISANEE
jgi:hypothetical protein